MIYFTGSSQSTVEGYPLSVVTTPSTRVADAASIRRVIRQNWLLQAMLYQFSQPLNSWHLRRWQVSSFSCCISLCFHLVVGSRLPTNQVTSFAERCDVFPRRRCAYFPFPSCDSAPLFRHDSQGHHSSEPGPPCCHQGSRGARCENSR